jgi:hypothetical protein
MSVNVFVEDDIIEGLGLGAPGYGSYKTMAPKEKDNTKDAKPKAGQGNETERSLKDVAGGFVEEVEKAGSGLIGEVKQLFDDLSGKLSRVAEAAVDTTSVVAQKVGKEPAHYIGGLLREVHEAGEASVKAIGESFDALRDRVMSRAEEQPMSEAVEGTAKKAATRASERVDVQAKKAEERPAARKPAKKTATKKTATKKKTTAKKQTTTKKTTTKKAATKKATSKKKATGKKKVTSKKAAAAKDAS